MAPERGKRIPRRIVRVEPIAPANLRKYLREKYAVDFETESSNGYRGKYDDSGQESANGTPILLPNKVDQAHSGKQFERGSHGPDQSRCNLLLTPPGVVGRANEGKHYDVKLA